MLFLVSSSVLFDLIGVILDDFELLSDIEVLLLNFQISQLFLIERSLQLFLEHLNIVSKVLELLLLVHVARVLHDGLAGPNALLEREALPLNSRHLSVRHDKAIL